MYRMTWSSILAEVCFLASNSEICLALVPSRRGRLTALYYCESVEVAADRFFGFDRFRFVVLVLFELVCMHRLKQHKFSFQ